MFKTGSDSRGDVTAGSDGGCRYLRDPFPRCYCINITGATIPKILAHCSSGDFTSCRIYIDRIHRNRPQNVELTERVEDGQQENPGRRRS